MLQVLPALGAAWWITDSSNGPGGLTYGLDITPQDQTALQQGWVLERAVDVRESDTPGNNHSLPRNRVSAAADAVDSAVDVAPVAVASVVAADRRIIGRAVVGRAVIAAADHARSDSAHVGTCGGTFPAARGSADDDGSGGRRDDTRTQRRDEQQDGKRRKMRFHGVKEGWLDRELGGSGLADGSEGGGVSLCLGLVDVAVAVGIHFGEEFGDATLAVGNLAVFRKRHGAVMVEVALGK